MMSSPTTFADLCSDVMLEIFSYFSLNELCDVFIDLIPCLPTLLNQNHIKLHIDRNANEVFCSKFLSKINPNQILSLGTSHLATNVSQFSSLRSIKLNPQVSSVLYQLQYLSHLEQLSLQLSETVIEENTWLHNILLLSNLRKLKLDLTIPKKTLLSQKYISIDKALLRSNTLKHLDLNIPMSWESILGFLEHFPYLQVFRASLYRSNSSANVLTTNSHPLCFNSLQILDLQGYFDTMSSMVLHTFSSMVNLKRCRLIAINVTNDNAFDMAYGLIWQHLFHCCSRLTQLKVHLLMTIKENYRSHLREIKNLVRTFNNTRFCEEYHFHMEQRSLTQGYVTLIGDYDTRKLKLQ